MFGSFFGRLLLVVLAPMFTVGRIYEAENGTLTGAAKIATCSRASNNKYVNKIGYEAGAFGTLTIDVLNVYREGTYAIQIEYISANTRNVDILINGGSATNYVFSSSGSWCYQGGGTATKVINLYLESGDNTIKFRDWNSISPLIDYIDVPTYPLPQGTIYEAEDALLGGTSSISSCNTASNGELVENMDNGALNYIEFDVTTDESGIHHMIVGYYTEEEEGDTVNLVLSFDEGLTSSTIVFPSSDNGGLCDVGGKPNYYSINVNLTKDVSNTIRVSGVSGESAPIIDFITISKQHIKKGLISGNTETQNDYFSEYVSWYYRYNAREDENFVDWATENNIEYVPIIANSDLWPVGGGNCALIERDVNEPSKPLCTYQQVEDTISSNNMSRVKYVMGTNEPWNSNQPGNMTFSQGVFLWKTFIQPLKANLGIKLVSPNVKQASSGLNWLEGFLKGCFDDVDCDEDLIDIFAVHEYKCKRNYWNNKYNEDTGSFFTNMKNRMGTYGSKDWDSYIDNMKLWVTETNCFWETTNPHPSNIEQCESITHENIATHGLGSIQWMDRSNRIERYAWWTTTNSNPSKTQLLVDYDTDDINPCGRGYKDPISTTSC